MKKDLAAGVSALRGLMAGMEWGEDEKVIMSKYVVDETVTTSQQVQSMADMLASIPQVNATLNAVHSLCTSPEGQLLCPCFIFCPFKPIHCQFVINFNQ